MAEGSLLPAAQRPFGDYELLARLATGGMAEIFLARRASRQGAPLVIKRMLPHLAEDARFVAMFHDEARVAARLEHPNVCRVLDVGRVGDTAFMALEYLHGVPLSRLYSRAAREQTRVDPRLVVLVGVQAATGLHAAHELALPDGRPLEVVHRDVSPPNLFVTVDGVVKLLDFGVAKANGGAPTTRTGTIKGKNAYMSPEQVLGRAPLDRRSDVFALGICLWEGFAGDRLFNRDTDFLTFRAIAAVDVPPLAERRPDLPAALVAVVDRCLARAPDDRYPTAAAVGDALAAAAAGLPGAPASAGGLAAHVEAAAAAELAAKSTLLAAALR